MRSSGALSAYCPAASESGLHPVKIADKLAHLIFERRERADVVNFALLVECSYRLGPDDLAAGRAQRRKADIRVNHPDGRLDHLAAIVDLGDDPVSLVAVIETDRDAGPFGWRVATGLVREHITVPIGVLAGDDNPGFVRFLAARGSRVDRHGDADEIGNLFMDRPARFFDARASPQCAGDIPSHQLPSPGW